MSANPGSSSDEWSTLLFRAAVIAGMATCFIAGWVLALETVADGWRGDALVWLTGLLTLETLLVEARRRRQWRYFPAEGTLAVRLAEIAVIAILAKASQYLPDRWGELGSDLQRWMMAPESFFDGGFWIAFVLLILVWWTAISTAASVAEFEDSGNLWSERKEAQTTLQTLFLLGALLLLVATGIPRVGISSQGFWLRPVSVDTLALLPILYVGLGILLFGQARFSLLLSGWTREHIPIAEGIDRRWTVWALVLVACGTGLALLLPAGTTGLGLFLLGCLAAAILFVGQLLTFLAFLVLSILLAPFTALNNAPASQVPSLPTLPDLPSPAQPSSPEWLLQVRLIAFIVAAIILLLWISRAYWYDRRVAAAWRVLLNLAAAIAAALRTLFGRARTLVEVMVNRREQTREQAVERGMTPSRSRWARSGRREQVRRLYLTLIERAAKAGHPRRPEQTPNEYMADLAPHLDDQQPALTTLTEAFLEARYSSHEIEPLRVAVLVRAWQRLQRALRRIRRSCPPPPPAGD